MVLWIKFDISIELGTHCGDRRIFLFLADFGHLYKRLCKHIRLVLRTGLKKITKSSPNNNATVLRALRKIQEEEKNFFF